MAGTPPQMTPFPPPPPQPLPILNPTTSFPPPFTPDTSVASVPPLLPAHPFTATPCQTASPVNTHPAPTSTTTLATSALKPSGTATTTDVWPAPQTAPQIAPGAAESW